MEHEGVESVLLADGNGGYYAVPLSIVQEYRVTDEYAAGIASELSGGEVSGYMHPMLKRAAKAIGDGSQSWSAMAGYYVPEMAIQSPPRPLPKQSSAITRRRARAPGAATEARPGCVAGPPPWRPRPPARTGGPGGIPDPHARRLSEQRVNHDGRCQRGVRNQL